MFNFDSERALAMKLTQELTRQLSPELFADKVKGDLSVNRISRVLEHIYVVAGEKNKVAKMGVIRRSILANTFKWQLKEAGYPGDFVDMVTHGLLVGLMKKK